MSITLIWAMARNGVIGRDNQLPWRLPADLAFFKEQTIGKTILMGRKTWESMNARPLPNRKSVILTRDEAFLAQGAEVIHTVEAGLELAQEQELMVIGGSEIFKLYIPFADRLLVTLIDEDIEGDVIFPKLHWEEFQLVAERQGIRNEKNPYDYRFLTYAK